MDEVDVVLVNEEHDDPFAHALQGAPLPSMVDADARGAGMEMFERPEQTLDRWSAGEIDATEMVRETGGGWGGRRPWWTWYQPILDVARAGVPIVAANALRTVVRRPTRGIRGARSLPGHPGGRPAVSLDQEQYWTTFDTMREFRGDEVDEDDILATFRSQMVWDATMAQSIANAGDRPDVDRVLHLVGRFPIDHDSGTTRELRRLRPDRSVLTVSCVQAGSIATLATEDLGRGHRGLHPAGRGPGRPDRRGPLRSRRRRPRQPAASDVRPTVGSISSRRETGSGSAKSLSDW